MLKFKNIILMIGCYVFLESSMIGGPLNPNADEVSPSSFKFYLPKQVESMDCDDYDPFQLELAKKVVVRKNIKDKNLLEEKVIKAIGSENIEGIILGRGSVVSKVLINGWVFGPVDEISFPNSDGSRSSPILGVSLLMLAIMDNQMVVRAVSDDSGESSEINVPFDSFFLR